jgi:capsular polysaccharide transport system permease protein
MTTSFDDPDKTGARAFAANSAALARRLGLRRRPLFLLMVALPSLLAAIYYFLIAAPIYVSEARFLVRAASPAQPTNLNLVLQGVGLGATESDAFAVHAYITSRNAIDSLIRLHDLRAVLARPEADFLERFPRPFQRGRMEDLYKSYGRFVSVGYDGVTGMSTLRVSTFRSEDSRNIALALLASSEVLINQLNEQAESDAVTESTREVTDAQARLNIAQSNLTAFRNHERLIDPARASAQSSDMVSKLSTELAILRAERAGLAAAAPQSPQLAALDDRINAYNAQITEEQARIAGETGSLAPKIASYEELMQEREFASRALTSAVTSLEAARIEARRKRLYLERVVMPTAPDAAVEPRRIRGFLIVLVSSLLAYGATILVIAGFREHRQA